MYASEVHPGTVATPTETASTAACVAVTAYGTSSAIRATTGALVDVDCDCRMACAADRACFQLCASRAVVADAAP
eukprot:scaffold49_cov409-Prasinococcus_capsulatus_cf.AAC.20